jgi:hypothetical protein
MTTATIAANQFTQEIAKCVAAKEAASMAHISYASAKDRRCSKLEIAAKLALAESANAEVVAARESLVWAVFSHPAYDLNTVHVACGMVDGWISTAQRAARWAERGWTTATA